MSRFRKWQNLTPAQTRALSNAVADQLLPILEAEGFAHVDHQLGQADWPVSGNEIQMERRNGSTVDSILFNFAKYGAPRVQVHASRRHSQPPFSFISACNLVCRRNQHYHFWGKPWWLPLRFWSERLAVRTAEQIAQRLAQLTAFLEHGVRGPNISRETRTR